MPTDTENVRFRGKTGSDLPTVKTALMTRLGHRPSRCGLRTKPVSAPIKNWTEPIGCWLPNLMADMRRRNFLGVMGGAAAWPLAARAQQDEVRRVGMLWSGEEQYPRNVKNRAAFLHHLRDLGYVEGKTIQIHERYAEGVLDRLPGLARELVALKVDVIVAVAVAASTAAHEATIRIPIVMVHAGNPIGAGLIKSLARPGGNVTGTTSMLPDVGSKQMALLHQVVPSARRVAFLSNPSNAGTPLTLQGAADAAKLLGLELVLVDVVARQDFEPAFARIAQSQAEALLVMGEPLIITHREDVIVFAAQRRLPALYTIGSFVRDGGLMSYSINFDVHYPRAADYVDKILKGASPTELPVEQPVGFELLVNLKTARALNLELQPSLLAIADEVIE
jgi:putative ABC transport system substrate-binding protein